MLACLDSLGDVVVLPPQVLTPASTAAAQAALEAAEREAARREVEAAAGRHQPQQQPQEQPSSVPVPAASVVGGEEAVELLQADALVAYEYAGSGGGGAGAGDDDDMRVVRVAVKVLDERLHCCLNFDDEGLQQDVEKKQEKQATTSGVEEDPVAGLRLRLRGPALAELRCLESWGWRPLVVPLGRWVALGAAGGAAAHERWLEARLRQVAAREGPMGVEIEL